MEGVIEKVRECENTKTLQRIKNNKRIGIKAEYNDSNCI